MSFPGNTYTVKRWLRRLAWLLAIPVVVFVVVIGVLYHQQDRIVQEVISTLNEDFTGRVSLDDSHIAPFATFPHISIDLEGVRVFASGDSTAAPIAFIQDVYIGFDLWTVLSGTMEIRKIRLSDGRIDLVQHADGTFNIERALATTKEIEDIEEEFHLNLQEIRMDRVDITKHNEESAYTIDAYFEQAVSRFRSKEDHILTSLDADFEMSLIEGSDTSFIRHKHFSLETQLDYFGATEVLQISPTALEVEGAAFNLQGSIDFARDLYLDLDISGSKPNFDLFIALAPDDLIPTLRRYENAGRVYFNARIEGSSVHGNSPHIEARFGCENAYVNNYQVNKKLDALNFSGYFTNGSARNASTSEFRLQDFSARPEAGTFSGNLVVKNFESPDIDLQLHSDFQLEFLAKFLGIPNLEEYSGRVMLTMNFHDIIDLEHPERSVEKLNESYFTQLRLENLSFRLSTYDLPIHEIDLYAEVTGHEARIDHFRMKAGASDLSIRGSISDLPAILHHTDLPVSTDLMIESKLLDLFELTGSDSATSVNEQIADLAMNLRFNSSARAFTESLHLPVGEFFIEDLHAQLTHYPHAFHDFHADVFIDENDFRVVDFKGMIDESDFFFKGRIDNYAIWFEEQPFGDTRLEFDLTSGLLQLDDLFSYRGANYVPEDYRHEELQKLHVHGYSDLHFQDSLKSIDLRLDKFDAKLRVHPLRLEHFSGRVHYEQDHLVVEDFSGRMGHSDFRTTLHYFLGSDQEEKKRHNYFSLSAKRLDLDELFNYAPSAPSPGDNTSAAHDSVFNIYSLPFPDMTFVFDIGQLNYHRYAIANLHTRFRTTTDHHIHIDEAHLEAAGGSFDITGEFNGADPSLIYLSPEMVVKNVNLDALMLKFDNFGQDHLVSENLHGTVSGRITGKIHVHADLVPKLDDSQLYLELEVIDGRLERYALFNYMADYFKDKNLQSVRFDTLRNTLSLENGLLSIPEMRINSTLGFMELSGTQGLDLSMDYYLRIPWKMVTTAASSKLFGRKPDEIDPEQEDAIQYADEDKRIRYLNIRVKGTPDTYDITLEKEKKRKRP